jgi:predicted ATPase/DNA-binding SARP family transcriptional activator
MMGPMEAGLELRVLGSVEVLREGRTVPIGGPKPRLVLAMLLASRGSVVSSDRLCEELWGDTQPADPGAVLQSQLSRLRRLLRPEVEIVTRPPGYVLEVSGDRVDAGRFDELCRRAQTMSDPRDVVRALEGALACFHGAPFEEFADRDWARVAAVRLAGMRVKAWEDCLDARLALGDHVALVPELEALVEAHPLRERPWQQLVLALYRSGRTAEGLRRVASVRALMRDELGLELSPGLRDLEARLLIDDPALLLGPGLTHPTAARPPPVAPSRLVGREAEIDRLVGLLRTERLLTLTGPGGVGKTRIALRLAGDLWDELGMEVFIVELASVHDPASTVAAIATAVDVQQRQHLSVEETLFEYLGGRRVLLVLDNCEHLRAPVASLVERLLSRCAGATVLTTSREVLGLAGEHVWRVKPLVVADPDADVDEVAEASAVRLFVERAAASRDGFVLDRDNAGAIANIVRRVDGLPLAIELAAARMRAMSPAALAARLDTRLDLLEGAQTSMIPRHRTLSDLVLWSHELLDEEEQHLFARLCVFAGGFGLDAVESVCADRVLTPERSSWVLANLVDKSMVQLVDPDVPRYRLLETLREFGHKRLGAGIHAEMRKCHARWFLHVAERFARALAGPGEADAVSSLDRDFDNLRAAHQWSIEVGEVDVSLRLIAALREYSFRTMRAEIVSWADDTIGLPGVATHPGLPMALALGAYGRFVRGDLEGAIEQGERAINIAGAAGSDTSGLAERAVANALFYRGEPQRAMKLTEHMIASARQGSPARLAHALYMRSVAHTSVGDNSNGRQIAEEASAAARASGSPTANAQASYALGLALESTDPAEAAAYLEQAADLARQAGNRWIEAFALTEVLWLQARQNHPRAALARYSDVIDLWYRGGDWANQWLSLRHVFGILVQLRDYHGAATLHGALTAAGAAYALPFEASDAQRISDLVNDLRQNLGPATFAATVRRGASMSDGDIIAFVRSQIRALSS